MKLVEELAEEFGADNPWYIYRCVYKYTDCGPSIGFLIKSNDNDPYWSYCDDLGKLGTFDEMKAKGIEIIGVSVSSIVEGSDAEVSGETLDEDETIEDFWKLVESVNQEACFLWERDNSQWYCIKSPEGEQWSLQDTWGDVKWHCDDDDLPPKTVVDAVAEFLENGGNITWQEGWGTQTHKYDEYFSLPVEGWTMCEYLNDATY